MTLEFQVLAKYRYKKVAGLDRSMESQPSPRYEWSIKYDSSLN
jgi:hypothetical protein